MNTKANINTRTNIPNTTLYIKLQEMNFLLSQLNQCKEDIRKVSPNSIKIQEIDQLIMQMVIEMSRNGFQNSVSMNNQYMLPQTLPYNQYQNSMMQNYPYNSNNNNYNNQYMNNNNYNNNNYNNQYMNNNNNNYNNQYRYDPNRPSNTKNPRKANININQYLNDLSKEIYNIFRYTIKGNHTEIQRQRNSIYKKVAEFIKNNNIQLYTNDQNQLSEYVMNKLKYNN